MRLKRVRRIASIAGSVFGWALILAPAQAQADSKKPPPPPLAQRAQAVEEQATQLARGDKAAVAPKALARAKKWAGEAVAASKQGEEKQAERALLRAREQVALAQQLIELEVLNQRIAELRRRLATLRKAVADKKAKLSERDEYLNLLKVTRQ